MTSADDSSQSGTTRQLLAQENRQDKNSQNLLTKSLSIPSDQYKILVSPKSLYSQLSKSLQPVNTISFIQRSSSWTNMTEKILLSNFPTKDGQDNILKNMFSDTMQNVSHVERILPLLDVHSHSRALLFKSIYLKLLDIFNQSINTSLQEEVLKYIFDDLINEYDNELIKYIFNHHLGNFLPILSEQQLIKMMKNDEIYKDLPLLSKQYIWSIDSDIFFKEIIQLLESAIQIDQDYYRSLDLSDPFSKDCSLLRKQDHVCHKLAQIIFFPKLYNIVINFLVTSYENSSQDSIYALILFSVEYHIRKQIMQLEKKSKYNLKSQNRIKNQNINETDYLNQASLNYFLEGNSQDFIIDLQKSITQCILKILSSPKSKNKTSGALTIECLKDLHQILLDIPNKSVSDLKLSFILLSSPVFIHLLSNTLYDCLLDSIKSSTLVDPSKLTIILSIIEFICQDIDLSKKDWAIRCNIDIDPDIIKKLLPVCMMQLFCVENRFIHEIPYSQELNTIVDKSKCSSFIVVQTMIWSLKTIFRHICDVSNSKNQFNDNLKSYQIDFEDIIDHLCWFIKHFQNQITHTATEYWLEFISLNFYFEQINLKQFSDESKKFVIDQLFLFWLANAYYPANFIVIKFLHSIKHQLSETQWQYVRETALELDHESFIPD